MRKITLIAIISLSSCAGKNKKEIENQYYFEQDEIDIDLLDELDIDDLPEAEDEDDNKKQNSDKE